MKRAFMPLKMSARRNQPLLPISIPAALVHDRPRKYRLKRKNRNEARKAK